MMQPRDWSHVGWMERGNMKWIQDPWARDAGGILEPHHPRPMGFGDMDSEATLLLLDAARGTGWVKYPDFCLFLTHLHLPVPPIGKTLVEANLPQGMGKADGCLFPCNEEQEKNEEKVKEQTGPEQQKLQPC